MCSSVPYASVWAHLPVARRFMLSRPSICRSLHAYAFRSKSEVRVSDCPLGDSEPLFAGHRPRAPQLPRVRETPSHHCPALSSTSRFELCCSPVRRELSHFMSFLTSPALGGSDRAARLSLPPGCVSVAFTVSFRAQPARRKRCWCFRRGNHCIRLESALNPLNNESTGCSSETSAGCLLPLP